VEYELRNDLYFDDQNLAFIVPRTLGANNPKYYPLADDPQVSRCTRFQKKRIWISIENPYALMLPTNYESIKITLRRGSQKNMNTLAKDLLYTNLNLYFTKTQRKKACAVYVDFIKYFILMHSEYNSFLGASRLHSENPDGYIEKTNALSVELLETSMMHKRIERNEKE
jgi:hypothetical protein